SADLSDLTATIVDLAVQGYLRIEEFETRTFHFFTNRDYTLTKLREPEGRKEHERELMTALFDGTPSVKVSDLREKFYVHLPAVRNALYRQLSRRDDPCFASNPERTRRGWLAGAVVVLVCGVFLTSVPRLGVVAVSVLASGLVMLLFARSMPRRTGRGRQALLEIVGLREFVARV